MFAGLENMVVQEGGKKRRMRGNTKKRMRGDKRMRGGKRTRRR